MGFSTIIELDHDRWKDIADDPNKFAGEILEQLALGPDTQKEIRGGRIITCFHRGDSYFSEIWDIFVASIIRMRGTLSKAGTEGIPTDLCDPSKPTPSNLPEE